MKKSGQKHIWLLAVCIMLMVAMVISGCSQKTETPGSAGTGKAVELSMVSAFSPTNPTEWETANMFIDKVNKELEGKVHITAKGGPEVFPAAEQGEAVRTGAVDLAFFTASYWVSFFPEADAIKLIPYSPMDARKNGTYDYFDKLFMEKAGVKYLYNDMTGNNYFRIFLARPVDKPDLKGFILRTVPIYEPVFSALGATQTTMAFAEVFQAMERKVIDGFGYTLFGIEKMGLEQVVTHVIDYGFFNSEAPMVMNKQKWESLPKDVQDKMMEIAMECEEYGWNLYAEEIEKNKKLLQDKGVTFIKFSPEDEQKLFKIFEEAGWNKLKERTPEKYDELRKLLTQEEYMPKK